MNTLQVANGALRKVDWMEWTRQLTVEQRGGFHVTHDAPCPDRQYHCHGLDHDADSWNSGFASAVGSVLRERKIRKLANNKGRVQRKMVREHHKAPKLAKGS